MFASGPRYDPYTTMSVPPRPTEKTTCPRAAIATSPLIAETSNASSQATPAPAPGSVTERAITTRSVTKSTGVTIFETRSIPARTPFRTTRASASSTSAVKVACRASAVAEKPVSGGRIAAPSRGRPSGVSASASVW